MVKDDILLKVLNTWGWKKLIQTSSQYVIDLSIKLNRVIALIFKMRKYVSPKILRSIYFSNFKIRLSYCSLVWAQNCSTIQRIVILQKKAVRIINFQPMNSHTSSLFEQNSILKFQDRSLNSLSRAVFNTWFSFSSDQRN